MAFSGEDPLLALARGRIQIAESNPLVKTAYRSFASWWSQNKRNAQLQHIAFTETQADVAGGTVLLTGAATLYFAYVKKENSATDNFTWLYDDATDDTTAANARVQFPLLVANEEQFWMSANGLALATGIVVTQYTAPLGTTDGSNGGSGFVLIGA